MLSRFTHILSPGDLGDKSDVYLKFGTLFSHVYVYITFAVGFSIFNKVGFSLFWETKIQILRKKLESYSIQECHLFCIVKFALLLKDLNYMTVGPFFIENGKTASREVLFSKKKKKSTVFWTKFVTEWTEQKVIKAHISSVLNASQGFLTAPTPRSLAEVFSLHLNLVAPVLTSEAISSRPCTWRSFSSCSRLQISGSSSFSSS